MGVLEVFINLKKNKAILGDGSECELIELKDGENALVNLTVSKENEIGRGRSAKVTPTGLILRTKKETSYLDYDTGYEIRATLGEDQKGDIDFVQEAFFLREDNSYSWGALVRLDGKLFFIPVAEDISEELDGKKLVVAGQSIFSVDSKEFEKVKSKLKDKVFFYTIYLKDNIMEKIGEKFYKKILKGEESPGLFFYTSSLEKHPVSDRDKSLLMRSGTLVIFDKPVEPNKLGNVKKVKGEPSNIFGIIKKLDFELYKNTPMISQFTLRVGLKANCS